MKFMVHFKNSSMTLVVDAKSFDKAREIAESVREDIAIVTKIGVKAWNQLV